MDSCQLDHKLISEASRERIERILFDVGQLSDIEKLYLYLRLPSGAKPSQPSNSFYPLLGKKSHSQVTRSLPVTCDDGVYVKEISEPELSDVM